jgi:hypothetical protein
VVNSVRVGVFRTESSSFDINGLVSKGRGFDSHRGQANFSACPVWMHTQSNITNIDFWYSQILVKTLHSVY